MPRHQQHLVYLSSHYKDTKFNYHTDSRRDTSHDSYRLFSNDGFFLNQHHLDELVTNSDESDMSSC